MFVCYFYRISYFYPRSKMCWLSKPWYFCIMKFSLLCIQQGRTVSQITMRCSRAGWINLHLFLIKIPRQKVCTRGVDPNKFNFDLDPEFWSDLDPDPGLWYQVWYKEKHLKIILEKKQLSLKKIFFLNYKKIMAPENFFSQLSL